MIGQTGSCKLDLNAKTTKVLQIPENAVNLGEKLLDNIDYNYSRFTNILK
jgi:hypothetical protein